MKNTIPGHYSGASLKANPRLIDALARNALHRTLCGLRQGRLSITDGDDTVYYGDSSETSSTSCRVHVTDSRFYSDVAFGGSIGAGEAYMQGYWSVDDLTQLMRLLLQNRDVLDGMETGIARFAVSAKKVLHWMARNTRGGSRRNIQAHYDLGNDFFELFLDPSMMYSSAVFESSTMSLHEASEAKLDRICRSLALKPGDRVMEIGTGWGGFAIHAARNYGCHVTTTTISARQFDYAQKRIIDLGLGDRVELLLCDYRDLQGQYDKVVSIEMIEAVGHAYYDSYFRKCSELLKPDGLMFLQAITIADHRYESARRSVDFIQRYIFPGSCIPSLTAMSQSISRVTDLRIFSVEDIGAHYATTLRYWRENFFRNIESIRALGYSEQFIRMWEFYFCYCEAGFIERAISDLHVLLVKPGSFPVTEQA